MRTEPAPIEPMDPALAERALGEARDREQVFELLLRAARSRARFAALLTVHTEHVRGWRALAEAGIDHARLRELRIPRNAVPLLESAIASREAVVAPIATGEMFVDGFLESLGAPTAAAVVLPIVLGGRTVAFVVAHRGDAELAPDDVEDLFPLVTAGSRALARVLSGQPPVAAAPAERDRADTEIDTPPDRPSDPEIQLERRPTTEAPPAIASPAPDASIAERRARVADHRRAGRWQALAESIRGLVASPGLVGTRTSIDTGELAEDEQLTLLVELARVEAERLGEPERALETLGSAQAIDAADPRVLDALEARMVELGRWADLADLLEKRVALTEDLHAKTQLQLALATLLRERIADVDGAIAAYERVLQWNPVHELATSQLEVLYEREERWQPLVELLVGRASRKRDAVGIAALERAAHLQADRLGDARGAVLIWLAVIRREPERPGVLEHLYRLAPLANAWDEILGECGVLAETLEAQRHPLVAAAVWHLIGRWMRDRVGNRDAAVHAFEHAVRLAPDDVDIGAELVEILRDEQRWPALTELLSQRAEAEEDATRRAALYVELAAIHEDQQLHAEAIAWLERALAEAPTEANALVSLHRLYLETEAWELLVELQPQLVAALAATAPRAVIVDLHVELGHILFEQLHRPEDAAAAFREALVLDPRHAQAFAGLEQVYEALGETEALTETREAVLDQGTRAAQRDGYAAIATAWHDQGRPDRAAQTWQKLLALEPRHAAAQRGLVDALREVCANGARPEQGGERAPWLSLAAALRVLVPTVDPAERVALLVEVADLLESVLDDVDGALAASQQIVAIDPQHRIALDTLARLQDRTGRWQAALDSLARLLEATPEPRPRAELFARSGLVYLASHDVQAAQRAFAEALALDASNPRAHEGSARVHLLEGKLVIAGEELVRAAQLAGDPADTLRCLADAAWLYRHRLGDVDRAREALLCILEIDADHADAKQALAELLHDTRQWETLWPHLEQQLARAGELAPAERVELYLRSARCASELRDFARAIELYELACTPYSDGDDRLVEPTSTALRERADTLYRAKQLTAAIDAYTVLAGRHASEPSDRTQLAEVYRRLAQIHTRLGNPTAALGYHQKVLDIDAGHRPTLENLVELHLSRGHVDEAIASLRMLAVAVTGTERITCLEQIGDLYRDRLANPARAMSTYLEALELDEANHRILQRLLDLQSETGQWKAATETIDRFLARETEPARRASYHLASAEIRRTHLKDRAGVLENYEAALDELLGASSPSLRQRAFGTFQTVQEILTAGPDTEETWKALEQAYRRMIKRLAADDPALPQLWHALGEIYRAHLGHLQSAIEAFELAHSLDPDKAPQRSRILAELYAKVGRARPEVSERAAKLVEVDPTNPDAYRALGRASLEAGRVDEAWCVARALVFQKQANAEETALYRRHERQQARKATGVLDDDAWELVRHPDEDRTISAILALVWEAAVAQRAAPPKSFELKAKERMPVEHDTRVVAKIFRHTARVLNVPLPDVYVQPRRGGRLLLANLVERGRFVPAVIVGRDLMTGYRDTEIAAAVGNFLAMLRPAHYLKLALAGVDEIAATLAAVCRAVGVARDAPTGLAAMTDAIFAELQKRATRMSAQALAQLVARLPAAPDLARWRASVEATGYRASLLVCGELGAATRMASSDPNGSVRPAQRVADLVAYSVSQPYFTARRHLGLAIE